MKDIKAGCLYRSLVTISMPNFDLNALFAPPTQRRIMRPSTLEEACAAVLATKDKAPPTDSTDSSALEQWFAAIDDTLVSVPSRSLASCR